MTHNFIVKTLTIEGMTCINCEIRIQNKLKKTQGITDAEVSFATGKATITYDSKEITPQDIEDIIEKLDYKVAKSTITVEKEKNGTQIIAVIIIIFSLYTIMNRFGVFNIFNAFPVAEEGMGYAMLFIIGVFTSIHCVAMCGGINLSQCVPHSVSATDQSKMATLKPTFLYNLGRVISYTVIGGVVGALGSVISFSGTAKGIVQLIAGIFMVIMGLNMLNIFPGLKKINPHMPKIFAKKINESKSSNSPLYVGLLNGLMPCGPLQAMQIYALSTGNPWEGAISMFLFSLGTVPLMFGLGALSSILSKKFTHKMMKVSAVLVVILGVYMFSNGMSLSGFVIPSMAGNAKSNNSSNSNVAEVTNGIQIVTTKLSAGSYEPITVQKDIPVKWTIQAGEGIINGCNNSIIIPEFNKEYKLKTGDNIIEFTPTESGSIPFSCWMGMIRSKITVVDDINNIEAATDTNNNVGGFGKANNSPIPTDEIVIAEIKDGIQTVEIDMNDTRFLPAVIVLQEGVKTSFTINATKLNEDNSTLIFPIYNAQISMKEGKNPISFIPEVDFDFSTSDKHFSAYVKVVKDISKIDIDSIKSEVKDYVPTSQEDYNNLGGGASCH